LASFDLDIDLIPSLVAIRFEDYQHALAYPAFYSSSLFVQELRFLLELIF